MLKISNVETFYGKIQALRGVDLDVNDGEIVSLIGSNEQVNQLYLWRLVEWIKLEEEI